ncbi:uncharacterized protein LACBIDRAFT_300147 [Laccaria bicolor S238N-H82]|uniref:Predicted protein n=1 Tax=Laccaria bicolor (strain S238N-H82 / ATCC MYA-4686) TaxID=486041 RepID=B0DG52_LACBS|nr:uncharacterized protein LACBIDRAFT_300147 [Laccaria bicolor S238N-H82]EDR06452.1 predicted protein [Laccaria bicolor S238N-H82]|eukprot:XP_001882824.1 predicted protein [Laccaria bicolor S238N-H82]
MFSWLGFASKTPRKAAERKDSQSVHSAATAGQPTPTDDHIEHHQSVPHHRDNEHGLLEQSSRTIEPAKLLQARKEPKRGRSRDSHDDKRGGDVQESLSRRETRDGSRKLKEARKYGKEDVRALMKDKEELKLQLNETISRLNHAEDTGHRTKQKLRKAEEELQQLAKRDAETTNRLRTQLESQHRHGQSLEAKIRQQTADISALREQLRRAEAKNSQTNQLLDVRSAELKGAQVFLTKADSFAGADLVKMAQSLNSEIFQGAAFMSEGLEFDELAGRNARLDTQAMERAKILVGSVMFSQLLARLPTVDPLPLQLALQSIMILRCVQIIQSLCPMEYRDHNDFLKKIYAGIQASEEQAVAGRWRALTQAQLRPSRSYGPHIAEDLVTILKVCGLSTSSSKYQIIIQDIKHRMSTLEKAALQLKVALKEGVTSVDIEAFYISTRAQFDPTNMDDAYGDSRKEARNRRGDGERIMCTTDMGLRRVLTKRSADGQAQSYYDVILKPKVVLASSLTDEAEAQTALGEQSSR